jgi:hypothetical protein
VDFCLNSALAEPVARTGNSIQSAVLSIEDNHDRSKDVTISGDANITSVKVEQALDSHAAVLEAAVIGVPDKELGEIRDARPLSGARSHRGLRAQRSIGPASAGSTATS